MYDFHSLTESGAASKPLPSLVLTAVILCKFNWLGPQSSARSLALCATANTHGQGEVSERNTGWEGERRRDSVTIFCKQHNRISFPHNTTAIKNISPLLVSISHADHC